MSVSDSEPVMIRSSLLVFEFGYLRFRDWSRRLLENEYVFVNLVDAKSGRKPERSKIMVVFSSVPDDNVFELVAVLNPLLDAVNMKGKEFVFLTKIHDD